MKKTNRTSGGARAVAAVLSGCFCLTGFPYSYRSDFTVKDDVGEAYCIDIDRRSHYSHAHGRVEDGRYVILLSGNRHFLTTPKLNDFTLDFEWSIGTTHSGGPGYGFSVRFGCDREGHEGSVIEFFRSRRSGRLSLMLDGRELVAREKDVTDFTGKQRFRLVVTGGDVHVSVCGLEAGFELPAERVPGYVAIDAAEGSEQQLYLYSAVLDSPEKPESRLCMKRRVVLGNSQGFVMPVVYDVKLSRFASGEMLVEATLDGTVRGRPKEGLIETGGREWGGSIEKLDTPYVRLEDLDGSEIAKLNFWNGERMLYDDAVQDHLKSIGRSHKHQDKWPKHISAVLRGCPDKVRVACGYHHAIAHPWRFAEEGFREKLLETDGSEICDGTPLTGRRVCRSVRSPADKRIVSEIPADLPKRAQAVAAAERQHFFYESEKVRFVLSAVFRATEWDASELKPNVVVTDVYGDPVAGECTVSEKEERAIVAGVRCQEWSVVLSPTPPVGVYKLVVDGVSEIFEVMSDDPDGPCPPLASGLPFFVSMPNELKYMEQSVFDPWGGYGGISHYYAVDNRYPKVADALEVWKALPLYRRMWWCWNWTRNSDDIDPASAFSRKLMKHADFYGGYDPARAVDGRYDLGVVGYYTGHQLELLREFLKEKGLESVVPAPKPFTYEAFRKLFTTCWREWVDWARPRIDAGEQKFVDGLLAVNPEAGQATYGPYAYYVSHYKTAYQTTYNGYPILDDRRLRKNGSFWLFEEYHHSCDYPLFRPAFFVATYDLHFGDRSRRIFPEIYYSGWSRCMDGAVYMAHPLSKTYLADVHQRRIAYQYAYGTPQFRDGAYKFWKDYGFHARNPEKNAMEQFIRAWRNVVKHPPRSALKAPFVVHDLEALKLNGEYLDEECNHRFRRDSSTWTMFSDVGNSAEDDISYAFEQAVVNGYTTPVVTRYADLGGVTAENAEFVILPPVVDGTPEKTLRAVRELHERGVGIICFEQVAGLEDLFGVKRVAERRIRVLPGECFSNSMAVARYAADGARTLLAGSERAGAPADIPVVLVHEGRRGRTVFVNVPPAAVKRSDFRTVFHWGQDSLSAEMKKTMREAFAILAPEPAVKSDHGLVSSARTAAGDIAVIVSDEPPIYKDRTVYPVPIRFTVFEPGIGGRKITADADFEVVSSERDRVVIRTRLERDSALFFRFGR